MSLSITRIVSVFIHALIVYRGSFGYDVQKKSRLFKMNELLRISKSNKEFERSCSVLMSTNPLTSPFVPTLKNVKNKINEIVSLDDIEAIRIRHIRVQTESMAIECKALLSKGSSDVSFADLASTLSTCEMTRDKGGELGWYNGNQVTDNLNIRSKENNNDLTDFTILNTFKTDNIMIPDEIINAAYHMNIGDISIVSSIDKTSSLLSSNELIKHWHIVQLMDVSMKLSPEIKRRKLDRFRQLQKWNTNTSNDIDYGISESNQNSDIKLSYSIDTMGCQMNIADSERMEAQLQSLGYSKSSNSSDSNIIILNTCAIRDHAEQKVYSYLGPHAQRKKKGEDISIIVAGCVAQQEAGDLIRRFPELDIVMGPQYSNRIGDLLESVFEGNQVVATDALYQAEDNIPAFRKSDITAYVNVIYGCNERCTYCVVPNTRGVEQSRTKDAIVAEVTELVANGYREITLLGQNIDSWGRNSNPKQKFADLLTAVGSIPGLDRVRFLTSHP
eukprot:gene10730-14414_t